MVLHLRHLTPPACGPLHPGCWAASFCSSCSMRWVVNIGEPCLKGPPPASRSATSPPQPASSDPSPLPLLSLGGPQRSPLQSSARLGAPTHSQPQRQVYVPVNPISQENSRRGARCAPFKLDHFHLVWAASRLVRSGSAHAVSPKPFPLRGRWRSRCRDG